MFTRCPGCHRKLPRNKILEMWPVGGQIAFDPDKGRLWVVCDGCRGWNLVPIEERWEAVEAAEKAFGRAAVGSSTANVTLARAPDGTRLLRVGTPTPPELAAWRYGIRLKKRWRRPQVRTIGGTAVGAVGYTALASTLAAVAPVLAIGAAAALAGMISPSPSVPRLLVQGQVIPSRRLRAVKLSRGASALDLKLRIPLKGETSLVTDGPGALSVLRRVLPGMNAFWASRKQIDAAVDDLVRIGSVERAMERILEELRRGDAFGPYATSARELSVDGDGRPSSDDATDGFREHRVGAAHTSLRLMLEMVANEEVERRALSGELALLEREWRDAEELAAISDGLLIPKGVRRKLDQLRAAGSVETAERTSDN